MRVTSVFLYENSQKENKLAVGSRVGKRNTHTHTGVYVVAIRSPTDLGQKGPRGQGFQSLSFL